MKLLLLCLLAACVALAACRDSAGTGGNSSPHPSLSGANGTTAADERTTPEAKPPTPAEARSALERIYKLAVVFDESRPDSFVAGDFNGDGSGDLAVAVRPSPGRLGEINDELLANWIIADPRKAIPFDPDKATQTTLPGPGPVKIEQGDVLLAVIHGHGTEGWRSPEATQSYLLKGAAQGLRAVPVRGYPLALAVRRNLNPGADIISGRLAGADGFLYWSHGKYVWHKR